MATETSTKFTYEDYLLFPDDGLRHEILDGEHYVSPSPNAKHQIVLVNILRVLDRFVHSKRLGRVFPAPFDVKLSEIDVVQPDILFMSNACLDSLTKNYLDGAPDLAIEIISESHRKQDEIIKKKRYELFGVAEYWIVDPELESVKIYRRTGDAFAPAEIVSTESGGAITTPLLPGFSIDVTTIFAE